MYVWMDGWMDGWMEFFVCLCVFSDSSDTEPHYTIEHQNKSDIDTAFNNIVFFKIIYISVYIHNSCIHI